jgi:peptidoglycan/xylan/chitin deacetylase (PgdA/CDA1 family)
VEGSVDRRQLLAAVAAAAFGGLSAAGHATPAAATGPLSASDAAALAGPGGLPSRRAVVDRYAGRRPSYWGLRAPGSWARFSTDSSAGARAVCLTFDACGSASNGYDARLISVLRRHEVPATLFVNRRWALAHPRTFRSLAADPLFEIGNHGTAHRPLSVSGRSAYGIAGTRSVGEVYDEIAGMHTWLSAQDLSPRFFRPGTAHADDIATRVARTMGQWVVGFSVNGDFGATANPTQVCRQFLSVRPGGIVLAHFNHPGSGTAAGVARTLPLLKERGYRFRRLSEVIPATTTRAGAPRH